MSIKKLNLKDPSSSPCCHYLWGDSAIDSGGHIAWCLDTSP